MNFPFSQKKAGAYALALMLVILAILTLTNNWWPGIMLAIGLPIALKQCLMGKFVDMIVSLAVFGGVFVISFFNISGKYLIPAFLFGGGIYVFIKELLQEKKTTPQL